MKIDEAQPEYDDPCAQLPRAFETALVARITELDRTMEPTKYQRPRVMSKPSSHRLERRLTWVLRFGAPKIGVPIRDDGYVRVDDLKRSGYFPVDFNYSRVARGDSKKRFSLESDGKGGTLIRANYGHGIERVKILHYYFTEANAPKLIIHVTDEEGWKGILKEGIKRRGRNEVHFVRAAPAPGEQVADVRPQADLLVYVDVLKAMKDGLVFGETPNGFIVTRGNWLGCVPLKYVVKVVHKDSGRQVYPTEKPGRTLREGEGVAYVRSHEAYDTEFAYFAWGKFGPDGMDIMMLVDTGASISVIPHEFYTSIPEWLRPPLQPVKIVIEVGNGGQLKHEGVCRLSFELGDFTFDHEFFVCRESTHAILGNEFLVHYGMVLRMAEGWLEYRGHDIPLFNQRGVQKAARVYTAQCVVLEPNTEAEVPTYIKRDDSPHTPQLFEPSGKLWSDASVVAPRMIFDPRDEHPRVRLYNPTNRPVTVGVSNCLGKLFEAEDIVALRKQAATNTSGTLGMRSTEHVLKLQTRNEEAEETLEELRKRYAETVKEIPEHIKDLTETSTATMTEQERMEVTLLMVQYADIFASNEADIGRTTLIEHDVDTGDVRPVAQAVRRQSPEEHRAMVDIVETLYRCGIIQPSNSQWAANIRMAKKKDGKWRMCIDYRDLNKRTVITDPYPLPRIDSLLDTLGRGKIFCALDLISGYHQVPMTRRAQEKSAFITPHMSPSHWEYKYMPFGLTGAPATFQRLVDTMLRGVQYNTVLAYLDDIIVIGDDVSSCRRNLEEVFVRIRAANLKLKPSKCELFKTEIAYLGHIVSANGVSTDPKKIKAVNDWPVPLYVTDVRGFLGFCNYYRRFIKGYIDVSRPLNSLLCKDSDLVWRPEHTRAFNALKQALTQAPLLALPQDGRPYVLDTDASSYGVGGVLSQMQTNDQGKEVERPIAFHGRLLLPREMRYCARRRELLAIVEMVQYFRCYLSGAPFTIRTDHDSLKGVKQLDKLTGQMARWVQYLEGFSFKIVVRAGKEHANADFLSRLYTDCFCKESGTFTSTPSAEEALANEPVKDFSLFEKVCREQADRRVRDKRTEMLRIHDCEALQTLSDHDLREQLTIATKLNPEVAKASVKTLRRVMLCPHRVRHVPTLQDIKEESNSGSEDLGYAFQESDFEDWQGHLQEAPDQDHAAGADRGADARQGENENTDGGEGADVSPRDLHSPEPMWTIEELIHAQANDNELKPVYEAKIGDGNQPDITKFSFEGMGTKYYIAEWPRLIMIDGLLYREWEAADAETSWFQLIIPKIHQTDVIAAVHSTTVGCHQGRRRTWEFIRRRYFWFEMGKDIRDYIRQCAKCQRGKNGNLNPKYPMTIFGAGFPNERVSLDMCGPIKNVDTEHKNILVICDSFTKYVVAVPIVHPEATEIAQAFLDRWCHVFGYPFHIHSDQGLNLTGQLWKELCTALKIKRTRTTPYRPQANGQNERTNRTIIELLRTTQEENQDWPLRIGHTCFAYNSTPHTATGCSPNQLMFGSDVFTDVDARMPHGYRDTSLPANVHARKIVERLQDVQEKARRRLQAAAESRKRYYDRDINHTHRTRCRPYQIRERVLQKVSDHHLHFGKLNDRYKGPYYVITVLPNGLLRVKEDKNKPPRIAHHDRLRRFDDGSRRPPPEWVEEAIQEFAHVPGRRLQRIRNNDNNNNDDGGEANIGNLAVADIITDRCWKCDSNIVDATGVLRITNAVGLCQTCALDLRSTESDAEIDLLEISLWD